MHLGRLVSFPVAARTFPARALSIPTAVVGNDQQDIVSRDPLLKPGWASVPSVLCGAVRHPDGEGTNFHMSATIAVAISTRSASRSFNR